MAGHVRKRRLSDGHTSYQARLPNPARPTKAIVKTFHRRRDAERWLTNQAAAIQNGSFIDPRQTAQPFQDLVTTWERTHLPKLAPKTRERYESMTRTYLIPTFGSTPLSRRTRADIKEWFASLAAERKSNGEPRYAPGTFVRSRSFCPPFSARGPSLVYSARIQLPGCGSPLPCGPKGWFSPRTRPKRWPRYRVPQTGSLSTSPHTAVSAQVSYGRCNDGMSTCSTTDSRYDVPSRTYAGTWSSGTSRPTAHAVASHCPPSY
jgi:hypothetical protein